MSAIGRLSAMMAIGMALTGGFVRGAPGPESMNYQGVLRDTAGAPITTDPSGVDVVFRFFDSPVGGNELLVDSHLTAGTAGVVVSDGLFNVSIGSGAVTAGSGTGAVSSLGDLFKVFSTLYLEVEIASEILTPRTRVHSAPYALNVLEETDVDSFASNEGYALESSLAGVATSGDFSNLTDVPFGLSDGDDDVLNDLACAPSQVPEWSGGAWSCGDLAPPTSPNLVADVDLAFPIRRLQTVNLAPFEFVIGTLRAWHSQGGELVIPMMAANTNTTPPAYTAADEAAGTVSIYGSGSGNGFDLVARINNLGDRHNLNLENGAKVRYTAFDRVADYDSDWFACAVDQTYPLAHSLGVFPHFAFVEVAENSDGSGHRAPTMSTSNRQVGVGDDPWVQTAIVELDANNVTLRTGPRLAHIPQEGFPVYFSYCRVRLFDWTPDYDSGWVPISTTAGDRDKWFQHDLDQIPSLQMLYVAEHSDGSGWCLPAMGAYHIAWTNGVGMYNTTEQWATVKGGGASVALFVDALGVGRAPVSGYVRYMAWR